MSSQKPVASSKGQVASSIDSRLRENDKKVVNGRTVRRVIIPLTPPLLKGEGGGLWNVKSVIPAKAGIHNERKQGIE